MTWISWRNYIDRATLEADNEVAQLPVDRIKIPTLGRRYRAAGLSVGSTRTTVKIAFDAAYRPEFACWVRPRRRAYDEEATPPVFAATDLVRHTLSSTDAHDGDLYDSTDLASGVANGYGYHCHVIPAGVAGAYASFEFDALSRETAPDNFVDWGYAHYGVADLEPEIDYAAPSVRSFSEGAVRRFSEDNGALIIRRKKMRRRWSLIFRSIKNASELAALEAFLEFAGDGGRFLMGLDRTDMARGVVVCILDTAAFTRTSRKYSQLQLPVLEAL